MSNADKTIKTGDGNMGNESTKRKRKPRRNIVVLDAHRNAEGDTYSLEVVAGEEAGLKDAADVKTWLLKNKHIGTIEMFRPLGDLTLEEQTELKFT